jgi:hypothetical protein
MKFEQEKVNDAEDTTHHIICRQSFVQDETEEEMKLQFASVTRHSPCTMDKEKPRCAEASQNLRRISTLR